LDANQRSKQCSCYLSSPARCLTSSFPPSFPQLTADWFTPCVKFIEERGATPLDVLALQYAVKDGKLAKLEAFPPPPGEALAPPSAEEVEAAEAAAAFEEATSGAAAAAAAGTGAVLAQPPSAAPVIELGP